MLKKKNEKYIATWWAVLLGSGMLLPTLFYFGLPDRKVWPLLLISALVEVIYYIMLSTAYSESDFSLVYPLARGAAPALIVVWSVLFLGEHLAFNGLLGLFILIGGLFVVGASAITGRSRHLNKRGILLALSISILISIYSVVDGDAVKQTSPYPYIVMVFFLVSVLTTPIVFHHYGWSALHRELTLNTGQLILLGILIFSAYLLALFAYSIAPISYSGAIREVSVVMGALAGWKFLGEGMGRQRLIGSSIIFLGIMVIALWG